eukprot:1460890-Amphidinium_carterae.1
MATTQKRIEEGQASRALPVSTPLAPCKGQRSRLARHAKVHRRNPTGRVAARSQSAGASAGPTV